MSNTDLHETLKVIGRTPDMFRRDTPLLLKTLDKMQAVNRRIAFDEGADISDGATDEEK